MTDFVNFLRNNPYPGRGIAVGKGRVYYFIMGRSENSRNRVFFRFRTLPDLKVTTEHFILCDGERFNIISVEDVKGRGMYTEVLARKVVPTNGKG